ncbi:hypothetical protein C8F04DRAFT_1201570 [Mycena alexandri]|uniref:Uncharacterized protein n=1 Tax=Mycena alexandri TaxID=1745969 RepID=A0AAD6RYK5_9AGAR|nr:hypothetical protein C8F04DRAFT_1201570 [Mycena alexandri]
MLKIAYFSVDQFTAYQRVRGGASSRGGGGVPSGSSSSWSSGGGGGVPSDSSSSWSSGGGGGVPSDSSSSWSSSSLGTGCLAALDAGFFFAAAGAFFLGGVKRCTGVQPCNQRIGGTNVASITQLNTLSIPNTNQLTNSNLNTRRVCARGSKDSLSSSKMKKVKKRVVQLYEQAQCRRERVRLDNPQETVERLASKGGSTGWVAALIVVLNGVVRGTY